MPHQSYTWHIHMTGIVQGIGFRPLVYQLAHKMDIKGMVYNDVDGVHIVINCEGPKAEDFYRRISAKPPSRANINTSSISKIPFQEFEKFQIVHDHTGTQPNIHLTPDFATCELCKKEIERPGDRRHSYAFTTCCECGPRYSIIHKLPFDRNNTEMGEFEMCKSCRTEYESPSDRRYYAQTNSCESCGVQLELHQVNSVFTDNRVEPIIRKIVQEWANGKIIAIKGIGGYLITCDASNTSAIETLRVRKNRPHKPFALMYPETQATSHFEINSKESQYYSGPVSPIILLPNVEKTRVQEGICDNLSRVGVMVPYAPIYQLLLGEYGKPIVATSANVSNSPIVFQDEKALEELFDIVDWVLVNDRKILVPQDDSVIAFSSFFKHKIIFRRSRGMAPSFFWSQSKSPTQLNSSHGCSA